MVEFLIVGSYALAFHAQPRYTEDIDFWVSWSEENSRRVREALEEFGISMGDEAARQLTENKRLLQLGIPPRRVDIFTFLDGCDWETAAGRTTIAVTAAVEVNPVFRTDGSETYVSDGDLWTLTATGVNKKEILDEVTHVLGRRFGSLCVVCPL